MVDAHAAVDGFLPSGQALPFTNNFPRQPVLKIRIPGVGRLPIGDASRGLCGGMVYTTRDLFEAKLPPPTSKDVPPPDSPLYRYLSRRLFDSFDIPRGVARYYRLMSTLDADTTRSSLTLRGAGRITVVDEWPRVRLDLDRGVLSPLGIITVRSYNPFQLGYNHQVLAYAYKQRQTAVTLRVYDPNTPLERADTVTMSFDVTYPSGPVPITHNLAIGGRPVRAFFRTRYRRVDPRPALTAT
ncbi:MULTISPECIES: hypothetical protein [Protofrankia]|uniref:Uncharacterized protein n=1 Tax=Candidatus Protofrankia datiscae TaxID=2716812 RepID=F8B3P8_9ACTN|nr:MULTISPECIES: hypothetical protein [Protofrankia]AEH07889.1 hypothetical protein FsymDg_0320 [Candidatus Protofrankia datiscae]